MGEQLVQVGDHQVVLDTLEGDVITDVMVLARVMRIDGKPGHSALIIGESDRLDHIVQMGMLATATGIVRWEPDEEDDDE